MCVQSTVLIMAHMTKQPFAVWAWPLVVLVVVIANDFADVLPTILGIDGKDVGALLALAAILVGYLHYVVVCVQQITHALGINCLTISHYKADKRTEDAQPSPIHSPRGTSMRLRSHDKKQEHSS